MRTVLLTLRPSRLAPADLPRLLAAARRLVSLDLWPTDPRSPRGLEEGDHAFLHLSQHGVIGEATLHSAWRPWTVAERRLLPTGAPSLDNRGGVELRHVHLWDEVVHAAEFGQRRFTNDVTTLRTSEVAALLNARASRQPIWEPWPGFTADPDSGWVVVDEVLEGGTTLEISRWPSWDELGVRFLSPPTFVRVDSRSLTRLTNGQQPQAGNAFATSVRWSLLQEVSDDTAFTPARLSPAEVFASPPTDVTEAGRQAAQVSFFQAVTGSATTVEDLERFLDPDDEELG